MATYLFTWNPGNFLWENLDEDVASCKRRSHWDSNWSCGVRRNFKKGDRAFLIRLGKSSPSGIMASGWLLGEPYEDAHWRDAKKSAYYVNLRFDVMLHPLHEQILLRSALEKRLAAVHWTPQASGIQISAEEAAKLEKMWTDHLTNRGLSSSSLAEEIVSPERYVEGAVRQITVNAYERDLRARRACIEYHGCQCAVCELNFSAIYGEIGKGFIHVHHLKQLSQIRETYEVDPVADLRPVCPNCHAMLHKSSPPFSLKELRSKMRGKLALH